MKQSVVLIDLAHASPGALEQAKEYLRGLGDNNMRVQKVLMIGSPSAPANLLYEGLRALGLEVERKESMTVGEWKRMDAKYEFFPLETLHQLACF